MRSFTPRAFSSNYRLWIAWFFALTVIFAVNWMTLTISPIAWQDEVQIIDYGRVMLEPNSDWSINWNASADRPILLLSYLGTTLQELALRAGNLSMRGPRVASLLGAMFAATMALGWLLSRKVPGMAAWLLSLIFLLDPLFVQSYRGARIDCWALALCLGSCWLLGRSTTGMPKGQSFKWPVVLAGALAVASVFIWPSAVILYPLIMLEFIELTRRTQAGPRDRKIVLSQVIAFTAGGIVAATVLIVPARPHLNTALIDTINIIRGKISVGDGGPLFGSLNRLLFETGNLLYSFKLSPILPLVALAGAVYWRKKRGLILATLIALLLVLSAPVYTHRVIYLLPYLLALISGIYCFPSERPPSAINRRIRSGILALLTVWAIIFSLIGRSAIALSQKEDRNPNILREAGLLSIGPGSYSVLLYSMEFYHAGRSLGWKMFGGPYITNDRLRQLLSRVDYAILPGENIDSEILEQLKKKGLLYQKTLCGVPRNKENVLHRLAILLKRRSQYGPYRLYGR